ncbi:MAG: cupin domain-containing protein [Bacteroidales bacterium]
MKNNIFDIIQPFSDKELIDILFKNENIIIERIISFGNPSPDGFWYNQPNNEWVILLTGEAEIEYKNGDKIYLKAGDYLLIPSNQEHRVSYTSKSPNCTWLCFYFK